MRQSSYTGYIYCYTNKINNKKYIGQTINSLSIRAKNNGQGYSTQFKFGKAIKKYGWENFTPEILETIIETTLDSLHKKLNEREYFWINYYNSYKNGYNGDLGGSHKVVSEQTKEKLRLANTGKKVLPEVGEKISKTLKGKKRADTTKYKLAAQKRKGIPLTKETIDKIKRTKALNHSRPDYIPPQTGKKLSVETKEKISKARINWAKTHNCYNKGAKLQKIMEVDLLLEKLDKMCKNIVTTNSTNDKISLLKEYLEDSDFLALIQFLFNPYITTGIKLKKLEKELPDKAKEYNTLNRSFFELLNLLTINNTGSYKETWEVRCFINNHIKYKDFISKVITKNFPLGIDIKTINKARPDTLKQFAVQLANKYFDKPEVVEGKEFALTTKIDGSRIIAMKDDGKVSFWTRQGQKYEGLVDLEKELLECNDDNFVFDGEIVAIDTDKENTYKNTMKLSRTKDLEKHGLKMLVFDYMPIANFKTQKCPIDYSTRRAQLSAIFDLKCFKYFELLPILYKGTNTSKITEILNEQVSKDEEGIMINICNAPYDFKRTNNLLKCKKFKDTEVEIIGFEEGANKLAGTLGAFVCKYKDNIVKVGSGLSDEDRSYFWANRDKYLGKLLTVKYFEVSVDSKTGLESLRFPIYMRVRED